MPVLFGQIVYASVIAPNQPLSVSKQNDHNSSRRKSIRRSRNKIAPLKTKEEFGVGLNQINKMGDYRNSGIKSQSLKDDGINGIASYDKYLSVAAKRRKPSGLRTLQKYVNSDKILMAGGMPNGEVFPLVQAELTLRNGRRLIIEGAEMQQALQYGVTRGMTDIRDWLRELQRRVHHPPTLPSTDIPPSSPRDMDLVMCNGCQAGISNTLEAILNEGDSILMEEASYANVLTVVNPLGAEGVSVPRDTNGMIPSELRKILQNWCEATCGPRPKVMYCCPIGGNPTGANWSLDRKREVYKIAREFDFLILEDDPYYYLQYKKPLIPSFLSMDKDGRVIRLDSFSKVLAAGARLGFISGPAQILEKLVQHMDSSIGSSNNFTQTIVRKMLLDMGYEGFLKHGGETAAFYQQRADTLAKIAETHLSGLAEWSAPEGGMFMWIRLKGLRDSSVIVQRMIEKGVVFVDGHFFLTKSGTSPFIRVSFSYASEADMNKAVKLLAETLLEHQQHTSIIST